ncbi:MAG TPA: hypothetical protein ENH61_01255 [Methylophaga aminisulfidivorans]|nr:hypothetical protein [Methylophaga aminisulfidivorans]
MHIIPVIDIQDGIVVHARGGERAKYQPLKSQLTSSIDPFQVIDDLLQWFPFTTLYVADLDAIERDMDKSHFYSELAQRFSGISIWLDVGIKTQKQTSLYASISNIRLILGSESLTDLSVLTGSCTSQNILSLDKRGGLQLGLAELFENQQIWTDTMIAMSLDKVGENRGPDTDWLLALMSTSKCDWYAAGGVRGVTDLLNLQRLGVKGSLVASALHAGHITYENLTNLNRDTAFACKGGV